MAVQFFMWFHPFIFWTLTCSDGWRLHLTTCLYCYQIVGCHHVKSAKLSECCRLAKQNQLQQQALAGALLEHQSAGLVHTGLFPTITFISVSPGINQQRITVNWISSQSLCKNPPVDTCEHWFEREIVLSSMESYKANDSSVRIWCCRAWTTLIDVGSALKIICPSELWGTSYGTSSNTIYCKEIIAQLLACGISTVLSLLPEWVVPNMFQFRH